MMPLDVSMYRDRAVQPGTAMTAHGDEVRLPSGARPFLCPLRGPHARCNSISALPGSRRAVQPTRAPYPHQIARRHSGFNPPLFGTPFTVFAGLRVKFN